MNLINDACWGLIPARGGSKSVPMKNIAELAGRPLIDYGARAGLAAHHVSRVICSTDAKSIADRCRVLGTEVHPRPAYLATDEAPVFDMVEHFINDMSDKEGEVAEFIALIQPTSPFLLPDHLDRCIQGLIAKPQAGSAQTLIRCPHNHHAINQRVVEGDMVAFRYPDERRIAHNKQTKPVHHLFGNIIVFRTAAALKQGTVFADPSLAIEISVAYGFDCDGPGDFKLAEAMLWAELVSLPHLPAS